MSDLATLQQGWDDAAREDAMFYIITDPARVHGGWTPEEFFAHGQREIDAMFAHLDEINVNVRPGRALDFGCGVGRTTQALAERFKRVDGVDVSPEMVDRAKSHNQHPGRVEYHPNGKRIPFRAGTFDFVYSMIVLQHMPPTLAEGYIREFCRVLKKGGVAVFEIPPGPGFSHSQPWLSMYGAPPADVESWAAEAGADIVDVEPVNDGSYRYTAVAS